MRNIAVVLLSGDSTRFKCDLPKQLYHINGEPLFYYSINPFIESKIVDEIVVVSKEEYFKTIQGRFSRVDKKVNYVKGGVTRHESVKNAVNYLRDKIDLNDNVLVHDGARLCLDDSLIKELVDALKKYEAATLALPSEDTLGVIDNGIITTIPDRSKYVKIQTPQAFKFKTLLKAHESDDKDASDDAQLCLKLGIKVALVTGSKKLNKITTIEDIDAIKQYIKE